MVGLNIQGTHASLTNQINTHYGLNGVPIDVLVHSKSSLIKIAAHI